MCEDPEEDRYMEPTKPGEIMRHRHTLALADEWGSAVRCGKCGHRFESPMKAGMVACKMPEPTA